VKTIDLPISDIELNEEYAGEVLASLDLRTLTAFVVVTGEGPALILSDGATAIEFVCGLPGVTREAIHGTRRLARAVAELGDALSGN
jgi:hypothetical protein